MLEQELELLDEQVFEEEPGVAPSEEPSGGQEPKARPDDGRPMPELREVTVRYTAEDMFRMGGSAQALDEKKLQTLQYDDPNAVLLQVPGVYIRQEDGFGSAPEHRASRYQPESKLESHLDGGRRALRSRAVLRAGRLLLPHDGAH